MRRLVWYLLCFGGAASAADSTEEASIALQAPEGGFLRGDDLRVLLVNRGSEDWTYHFQGASNGCGRWYTLTLEDASGDTWSPRSPKALCTMAIVRPFDVVLHPSLSEQITVDNALSRKWFRANRPNAKGAALSPGTYTLHLAVGPQHFTIPVEIPGS